MSYSIKRYPDTNQPSKHPIMQYEKNIPTAALGSSPLPDGDSLLWEDIDLHKETVVARSGQTIELNSTQIHGRSSWYERLRAAWCCGS